MKYAETWLDVGRLPLRRRDRAAMVLALECLREDGVHVVAAVVSARRSLSEGGDVPHEVLAASNLVSAHLHGRRFRARLALLLRVLLRVDAGDYGAGKYIATEASNGEWLWHPVGCPSRPLWEAAR